MEQPAAQGASLRIGEVARRVGVSPSTVRAWERRGLVQPSRGDGRHRRYGTEDVARLREVRSLLNRGYSPPALRDMLTGNDLPETALAGARLRQARTRRGLSLRRAAAVAGVSVSYLSLVERGLAEASVSLLQRVAHAYGGTVLEFYGSGPAADDEVKLVRAGERRRLRGFDRVELEDLVAFPGAQLQVEIFTIASGGGSGGDYFHEGEEVIFVLEGQLDVWLDDTEHHHLEAGDTLYFRSTQRHRWVNPGAVSTRLLWTNTPPTF